MGTRDETATLKLINNVQTCSLTRALTHTRSLRGGLHTQTFTSRTRTRARARAGAQQQQQQQE